MIFLKINKNIRSILLIEHLMTVCVCLCVRNENVERKCVTKIPRLDLTCVRLIQKGRTQKINLPVLSIYAGIKEA